VALTDPPAAPDDIPPPDETGLAIPDDVPPTDETGLAPPDEAPLPPPTAATDSRSRLIRILGIVVIVAGAILMVAGVITWIVVQTQLADEKITVSDDAARFQGDAVDGPLTAYAQADVIEKHALEASGGLTYAELPRDDPVRDTVMDASFLRASLFTSVVAFGVAAMAFGLGVLFVVVGVALLFIASRLGGPTVAAPSNA
jgi:hypothetical protein